MSELANASKPRLLLEEAQSLYDRNLFLHAYKLTADYWTSATRLNDLSIDELIFGLRLAARLGGWRLSRWLGRAVRERDPAHPRVQYYTAHISRRGYRVFDVFRTMEANWELENADPDTQSSWLASSAVRWASVRDFERAHSCIDRARFWKKEDAWIWSCESDVLAMEDRWPEALASAESSWEMSPGAPYAARSLASSLLNLRRVREAAERIADSAEKSESYELPWTASWYLCALAETCEGEERHRVLQRAQALADKMSGLAPLADRETLRLFARAKLDVAELADDRQAMEQLAGQARSPFHRKVLENLRKNPGGVRIRLPFRNAVQKHSECLPTSIASAAEAMGIAIDADAMAAEITFGGTAEWAAAEWLHKQGLEVRFFIATPEVAAKLIQNGFAFVVTLQYDSSAHAVAVVGLDEAAGTLLIHDPQSFRCSEYLMKAMGANEAPLGPKAMIAVSPERAALLDQILPLGDAQAENARETWSRVEFQQGPGAARKVVADLAARQTQHPITRLLEALQNHQDGHTGRALAQFQELLHQFPGSGFTRANLLSCCRSLGNTALMRKTLADVVERGIMPGVQSQQEWTYPPSAYVCDYADLLRTSADTREKARKLLHSLLRWHGGCANAWHVLGDLLWNEDDHEGALLGYRLSACLDDRNEHYAQAYCRALRHMGREGEGLEWLVQRVRQFGNRLHGATTWTTWITALEEGGHPERALAASQDALGAHQGSYVLLAFLVPFFARMGRWLEAQSLLLRLRQTGNRPLFHQASTAFYRMRGELTQAIDHAGAWLSESPLSMTSRHELVDLIAKRDGPDAAVDLARQWLMEFPSHDEIEELYNRQLGNTSLASWRKYSVLLRRVKRNPEDGWAWRELAFSAIYDYKQGDETLQKRLRPRILRFLSEADRTSPEAPGTLRAHAEWLEAQGEWSQAAAAWVETVERDPILYGCQHAWNCSARLNQEQRLATWARIEAVLLCRPGHSSVAREMIMLAAQGFGVAMAEEAVSRWSTTRPDDPEVIEGYVDLLLDHGHGRTDCERALGLLLPALQRFPFQLGLRFSHASALQKLGRFKEAEEVLNEIVRRHPDNSSAQIQLAWAHHRHGQTAQALSGLTAAAKRDPQNVRLILAQAEILIDAKRAGEAREMIASATERFPKSVGWRESAIKLWFEASDAGAAVQAARGGVVEHPRGAYLWLLLGRTLYSSRHLAAQGETESCFRRSIALNGSLYEPADYLAILLTEQRRYAEAEEVLAGIENRLSDPSPARGRLAWIRRKKGQKREALDDLIALLEQAPGYVFGWNLLFEWLCEDKCWERARSLLAQVPPQLYTNTQIRQRRLDVLHKAGAPPSTLDAEWSRLLSDFPEDTPLHLLRYDSLREDKRWPEAAEVLRKIRALEPDNSYVLARSVEVLAHEKKKEESITDLMRIFFADTEPSAWPPEYAWEAIKNAQYDGDAYHEARLRLERGQLPTAGTVSILAGYAMKCTHGERRPVQPFFRTWFPDRGAREVMELLKVIASNPRAGRVPRAAALRELSNYGYQRLALRHWKSHRLEIEAEVGAWSEAARALVELKMRRRARKLMATWRERTGVSMWVIANYVLCCPGLGSGNLKEIRSSCRDALAGLRHDHCARYLAYREAEANALLGDKNGLRETWRRYREYFDGRLEEHEWFEEKSKYLLADLPVLVRLLENNERRRYAQNVRSLRWERVSVNLHSSFLNNRINVRWWWVILLLWLLIQIFRNP